MPRPINVRLRWSRPSTPSTIGMLAGRARAATRVAAISATTPTVVSGSLTFAQANLDATTWAEYSALTSASARAALVVSALAAPVTAEVRDAGGAVRASGTMLAPWASLSGSQISVAQLTGAGLSVSNGGATSAGWTLRFTGSNGRFASMSFGLPGDAAQATWSLPSFLTGQLASIGSITMNATGVVSIITAPQPNMWPTIEASGFIDIELVPQEGFTGSIPVAFGVPMPRGFLASLDNCRIETTGGTEIATDVAELARWRHLTDAAIDGASIRSVFVVFNRTFSAGANQTVRFRWGPAVTRSLSASLGITPSNVHSSTAWGPKAPPRTGEHPETDKYERDTSRNLTTFPLKVPPYVDQMDAQDVREPRAYPQIPVAHLQKCNLRGTARQHNNADWMRYLVNFAKTSVNDAWLTATKYQGEVIPEFGGFENGGALTEWVEYPAGTPAYEPWLYDRVGAIANVYAITGDVKWLRHTHRAAFYFREYLAGPGGTVSFVNPDVWAPGTFSYTYIRGAFTKKWFSYGGDFGDGKYLSTSGLTMAYLLTGDARLVTAVEDTHKFFNVTQNVLRHRLPPATLDNTGIYTERLLAQYLTAALNAYELTGNATYKSRTITIFQGYRTDQVSPPAGYPPVTGWLYHDQDQHAEGDATFPITWFASPWMSCVLMEAVWRYFMSSADRAALEFMSDMGGAMAANGTYTGVTGTNPPPDGPGTPQTYRAVYYYVGGLVGNIVGGTDVGIDGDIEHTPEMVAALLRAKWANQQLGRSTAAIDAILPLTRQSALWALGNWRRSATFLPEYRLAPKRKFNWWFGDNYDEQWLLTETGTT